MKTVVRTILAQDSGIKCEVLLYADDLLVNKD